MVQAIDSCEGKPRKSAGGRYEKLSFSATCIKNGRPGILPAEQLKKMTPADAGAQIKYSEQSVIWVYPVRMCQKPRRIMVVFGDAFNL